MVTKKIEHRMVEDQSAEDATFRAAASAVSVLADRLTLARMMGMTHAGKRDVYGVLGYDDKISAAQYRERYARGGIAGTVIDARPNAVWRGEGSVFEDEDPEKITLFETEWDALNEQHDVWSTLCRTHIQASLGGFAGLVLGALGDLASPLSKGRPGGLLYLTPYGGVAVDPAGQRGQVQATDAGIVVATWDENSNSRRYGQPLTYQLKGTNVSSPQQERPVHWSRVVHVPAMGFLDNGVYGPPGLEKVWNYLLDLDKVAGGGSEAFWLRANGGQQWNIDKKMDLVAAEKTAEKLQEQKEQYEHNISRIIRTRGVDINQLGSDVADFKGPVDTLVTLIAGTCRIPKRIFVGTERGELASGQDADNWDDEVKDCRNAYAHPTILRPFINRLIDYGYLTKPAQWQPDWPDIAEMSETERIDAAVKAASLNDYGQVIILGEEIRETYLDREPLTPEQIEAATPKPAVPIVDDPDLADEEDEQVDKIAAALAHGGSLTINVKG